MWVSLQSILYFAPPPPGTYGTVFKAKDRESGEIVALKVVRLDEDDEVRLCYYSNGWSEPTSRKLLPTIWEHVSKHPPCFLSSPGGTQCSTERDMPPQGVETQEYCQVSYKQDDLCDGLLLIATESWAGPGNEANGLPHLFLML